MSTIFHIAPSGLGGWRVERIGTGESESVATREEAEARARELAAEAGQARVLVHDERGAITDEWDAGE